MHFLTNKIHFRMSDDDEYVEDFVAENVPDFGAEESDDSEASVELGAEFLGRDPQEDRHGFFPEDAPYSRDSIRKA